MSEVKKNTKDKTALVPRLRFPDFLDSPGWRLEPLSTFISALDAGVSVNAGDRPAMPTETGVLKTSCVTTGVFEILENKVVLEPEELERVTEPVSGDTIIISRMNTPALVGASAYVEHGAANIFLPDRLWAAKPTADANMRFIAYILGSDRGRAALSELAAGSSGSMKNIAKSAVLELLISAPEPAEQQKIADYLSSLDDLIAAQTQKLDTLKTHKKGLMQQLFPREGETVPRLRFPEFREAGEWKPKTIGNSCESFSGGTPSTTNKSFYGGEIPFIRSAEIDKVKTELFLTNEGLENSAAKLVRAGDILVALYGANSGDVALSKINGAINQAILCLRHETSDRFVYQYLSHKKEWIIATFIQGGQGNLSGEIIKAISLFFPNPSEQEHIADCLSSLDDLITAQTQKIDAIKIHKKGLIQQLFPVLDEVPA